MKGRNLFLILVFIFLLSGISYASQQIFRLGVVLSIGGLGDKSFNDAAYVGIQKVRKIPGCLIDVIEPSDVAAIESGLEYLASRKLDLIVAIGLFANEGLRKVAAKYPNQKFALIDSVASESNILSIIFNEEQGSFYAGAFAALLTKSGTVGFLGGMESPVISAFERGFRCGVEFVKPGTKVITRYVGATPDAFSRPEEGERLGIEMAKENADVIYHAAGATGLGLIQAARHSSFFVIGVDSDQSNLAPGKVPASMVKRFDVALYKAVRIVRENRFKGGILTLGLADGGVELVLSRFNRSLITKVIQERLKEVESFLTHKCY